MILVDSSVWIAHLRGRRTPATAKLEAAASREPLLEHPAFKWNHLKADKML